MYREIRKKKLILEGRKPFGRELTAQLREIGLVDMIYTSLRLEGSALSREHIKQIMNGSVVREATLQEHAVIENYGELLSEMESMAEMGVSLSLKTLMRLRELTFGGSAGAIGAGFGAENGAAAHTTEYRRMCPVVRELSYNPPHFHEIEEQMQMLMSWTAKDTAEESESELLKAAYFHNKLIEIYPFEAGNEELARIGLWYYMLLKGYPVFSFNFSRQEYISAVSGYIKNEDIRGFYGGLERSLFNKMDYMLQLTVREEGE